MKAFITGASGQLGFELAQLLGGNGIAADVADLDITDEHAVFGAPKTDIILNCAAYTNVDGAEENEDAAFAVNCLGAKYLTALAEKQNIPIVHVSTDYVFDGFGRVPYVETDLTNPQTVYGKTKLLGEKEVSAYEKHFIVRTAWLYGRNGKNFVKTIARLAGEREMLTVVSDQMGCPTEAKDLAQHILRLAETEAFGTYHCTGNGACSWYDFACEIVDILKLDCTIQPCSTADYPAKAKRPAYSVLSNEKLKREIAYTMLPWKDRLKEFLTD